MRTLPAAEDPVTTSTPAGDSVWREMFAGADASAPPRPGRYLETPQRLGILPTLAFWNRHDVWKSARWFAVPVIGASLLASAALAFTVTPWLFPAIGVATGVPTALTYGLLERHIRRRLGRAGAGLAAPARGSLSSNRSGVIRRQQ
jgi:hypothetical protein